MWFGKKPDSAGAPIDFDAVYHDLIEFLVGAPSEGVAKPLDFPTRALTS
jgi:hypothetical protein